MIIEDIKILCKDNFELAGTLYQPKKTCIGAIMIAPATGIKRKFYSAFATHLAENDYGVICFDNRGVGDSVKGSINKLDASLINWGVLDMPAVLEKLKFVFPTQNYHLIGHSAGGQLTGLMHNATDLSSMFNFAASSGSLKNMPYPFKITAIFYLNIFIPISNLFFGQTNSQWVGMGEPLPKKVASQWKKWCNGKGYVENDFGKDIKAHLYYQVKFPSIWLHATDDGIANDENVKDMMRIFPNSKAQIIALNPSKLGYAQIGHMKFFSSKKKELWKYALNWLAKHNFGY